MVYCRYNRIVLEAPAVRAAAVSALAKMALAVPAARDAIVLLLRPCAHDDDDEARAAVTWRSGVRVIWFGVDLI